MNFVIGFEAMPAMDLAEALEYRTHCQADSSPPRQRAEG